MMRGMSTRLETTGAFSFSLTAQVLARLPERNVVERWNALLGVHQRALEGRVVTVTGDDGGVALSEDSSASLEWARLSFGLDLDPSVFYEVAARDEVLRGCVTRLRGLRPPLMDFWEAWVAAILGQQITLSFCLDTIGYLSKRVAGEIVGALPDGSTQVLAVHPTPEMILSVDAQTFYECKVSRQKAAYLRVVAQALLEGYFEGILELPLEEALVKLTALKGVGNWTARYWLATVGRLDSLAYGDAGLASAYKLAYGRTHDLEAWGESLGKVRGWAYYYLIWGVKYLK
jgi:3-methyladenine DNA glycosylase/8-oxoguanine DNA glycosylase